MRVFSDASIPQLDGGRKWLSVYLSVTLFSVPFFGLAVMLGEYPLTWTLVMFSGLLPFVLFTRTFNTKRLVLLVAMLVWFGFTAASRWPMEYYIKSLFALGIVLSPFIIDFQNHVNPKWVIMGAISGFVAMLPIACYDALSVFHLVPPLVDLLPLPALAEKGNMGSFGNLFRARALFLEPAHYALYLVSFYAGVDMLRKMTSWNAVVVLQVIVLILLVLTFSIGGYLMMAVYLATSLFFNSTRNLSGRLLVVSLGAICATICVLGLFQVGLLDYAEFSEIFNRRLDSVYSAFFHGQISGSEGTRVASFLMPITYMKETGIIKWFIGEGYANFEMWVVMNHASAWGSSLNNGILHNILSIVFISTGIVGTVLFIFYNLSFLKVSRLRDLNIPFFVLVLLGQASGGNLVTTLYWGSILFPVIIASYYRRELGWLRRKN